MKKKEITYHVICCLPHRKRKEKKAGKLFGKQADVTTEQFIQFLSSSAWLYIFWIYIDSNKEERERERKWESFINDIYELIILSLLHESCVFITITYEILFIYWLICFRFWKLFNLDNKKDILYQNSTVIIDECILVYNKCPETISLELFKLRIYERIHVILQECSMYDTWYIDI